MKKPAAALFVTLVVLLAPGLRVGTRAEDQKRQRVVLISFDGLRPEVYRDDRFKMPNLRNMTKQGVQAKKVVGIFPTVTYPSHTSIVTGVRAARHGIVSNTVFDPVDGGKRWYWEAAHIRARPVWEVAHRAGLKTAAIRWPVTVGGEIDWHLPEVFGVDDTQDDFALFKKASTPGLVDELKIEAPKGFDEPAWDAIATRAAAWILEKKKPDLLVIHLVQADGEQHGHGRDAVEVVHAFEKLDEHLGTIMKALETAGTLAETNLIVTGDHGFLDVHSAVRPNVLLREAGLVTLDADGKKIKDWTALCQAAGGSAPIYLRDPADKATVEKVLGLFRSAASSKYRGIFNLLDREALDREEAFPGAIGAIECEPGYTVEFNVDGPVLATSRVKGMHGYLPTREELATGFVAVGPGIAQGRILPSFRQIDVAPLVAHLLGVDMGPAVEGVLVPGVLAPR